MNKAFCQFSKIDPFVWLFFACLFFAWVTFTQVGGDHPRPGDIVPSMIAGVIPIALFGLLQLVARRLFIRVWLARILQAASIAMLCHVCVTIPIVVHNQCGGSFLAIAWQDTWEPDISVLFACAGILAFTSTIVFKCKISRVTAVIAIVCYMVCIFHGAPGNATR